LIVGTAAVVAAVVAMPGASAAGRDAEFGQSGELRLSPAADYLVDAFERFPLVAFSEPRHGAGCIAGEAVPRDELKQIWENTTIVTGIWTAPAFQGILDDVRAFNASLPPSRRVRVLVRPGGPGCCGVTGRDLSAIRF
jgi:hypothetical protein